MRSFGGSPDTAKLRLVKAYQLDEGTQQLSQGLTTLTDGVDNSSSLWGIGFAFAAGSGG